MIPSSVHQALGHRDGGGAGVGYFGTSPDFFARWRILNQVHIVVAIVGCFIHLGLQLYRGTILAPAVSLGFGVIAIGAVNDILYSKDLVTTGSLHPTPSLRLS